MRPRRPANSRLGCGRLERRFPVRSPEWRAALRRTFEGPLPVG
ncbi:MAG: hypothetical protein IH999_09650 [Proteobacteria bacterium]|nr:hypothetical protein [Pseudomonadota bacterium]